MRGERPGARAAGAASRRAGPSASQQAAARSLSGSCGSSVGQRSKATGQRGWKRQPLGIAVASGGSPWSSSRGSVRCSTRGATASSAFVYGCCGSPSTCSVVPISTMRPRYITATRSHSDHASPTSWVISSSERARASRRSTSRRSTCVRTDTSSAETGSSHTSASGSSARAAAITTRWRWPPESSCGKRFQKRSAGANPASCKAETPRRTRSSPDGMPTAASPSCTEAPTVRRGLSDWYGSWKISCTRRRRARRSRSTG